MGWNTPGVRLDIIKELMHILGALKIEVSNNRVVIKKPGLASRWQNAAADEDNESPQHSGTIVPSFARLNASTGETQPGRNARLVSVDNPDDE